MVYIYCILDKLDHCKEYRRVSHPIKHIVDIRTVLTFEFFNPPMVGRRRKHNERKGGIIFLDGLGQSFDSPGAQFKH